MTCDDLIVVACCLHNLPRETYLEENGAWFKFNTTNKQPNTNNKSRWFYSLSTREGPVERVGSYSNINCGVEKWWAIDASRNTRDEAT